MPDNDLLTIRIEIDGKWTVKDMASFLANLNDLYLFRDQLDHFKKQLNKVANVSHLVAAMYASLKLNRIAENDPTDGFSLERWASRVQPPLFLTRMSYGSPGVTDVTGIAGVVGHLKDFLTQLIEWHLSKSQRDLENQARELNNQKQQIDNDILRQQAEQELQRLRLENIVKFLNVYDVMVEVSGDDLSLDGMKHAITFLAKQQEVMTRLIEAGLVKRVTSLSSESERSQV
jgi:hypothetical protein